MKHLKMFTRSLNIICMLTNKSTIPFTNLVLCIHYASKEDIVKISLKMLDLSVQHVAKKSTNKRLTKKQKKTKRTLTVA